MAVRVLCFLGGCVSPSPWNWVLFAGAALIPPIAVVLANAVDQRGLGPRSRANTEEAESLRPQLPQAGVIDGSVED